MGLRLIAPHPPGLTVSLGDFASPCGVAGFGCVGYPNGRAKSNGRCELVGRPTSGPLEAGGGVATECFITASPCSCLLGSTAGRGGPYALPPGRELMLLQVGATGDFLTSPRVPWIGYVTGDCAGPLKRGAACTAVGLGCGLGL